MKAPQVTVSVTVCEQKPKLVEVAPPGMTPLNLIRAAAVLQNGGSVEEFQRAMSGLALREEKP